jgi:hypothetical protein
MPELHSRSWDHRGTEWSRHTGKVVTSSHTSASISHWLGLAGSQVSRDPEHRAQVMLRERTVREQTNTAHQCSRVSPLLSCQAASGPDTQPLLARFPPSCFLSTGIWFWLLAGFSLRSPPTHSCP